MKRRSKISRSNVRFAQIIWGKLPKIAICSLKKLSELYALSLAHGHVQFLDGPWHVTHVGLVGGYGDADPSNASSVVRVAEMRVAETRALNRARRKAYGTGLCSVDELVTASDNYRTRELGGQPHFAEQDRSSSDQPRLRGRLCLLIRQHSLDPTRINNYRADF